jgi:hypothetical protein
VLSVPIPPGWDTSYTECFGYSMEDLFEEGARSNEARLRAVGIPLDDIAHFPFPMDIPPRERGERALMLLRAGLLGERNGPVPRDPVTQRVFFDLLARNARGEEVPRGTTIQWDFRDAEPWYLRLDGTGKRLVLWGGRLGGGRETRQTLAYDPAADRWSTLPAAPIRPRRSASAHWTEDGLIVWGGQAGHNGRYLLDGALLRHATP